MYSTNNERAFHQKVQSFRHLLDPTDLLPGRSTADLYSLRHLCLQERGGIPDPTAVSGTLFNTDSSTSFASKEEIGWMRAQAWRVLLGYIGPEKAEWSRTLEKQRQDYYQFVADFLPSPSESSNATSFTPNDALLNQIFQDLHRSRRRLLPFYHQEVPASKSCPLAPEPPSKSGGVTPRLSGRHGPLHRLQVINNDNEDLMEISSKPPATLQQDDDMSVNDTDSLHHKFVDRRWHSLLRILYIYALLNPSVGYVQGMNEVLFVLLYVFGTSASLPSAVSNNVNSKSGSSAHKSDDHYDDPGEHAEADAFWCFSALIGEMRDLYDFEGMDYAQARLSAVNERKDGSSSQRDSGMAAVLKRFSLRLKWVDEDLWNELRKHSLDPALPYYSFRWLACLISTELPLPSVLRVWDALLSESNDTHPDADLAPKVDFLLDICCSMLTNIRRQLLDALGGTLREGTSNEEEHDSFSGAMEVLQTYPVDDIEAIVEKACIYRQRRIASPLTGDAPPLSFDGDDTLASIRNRAITTLRAWGSPSSTKTSWLTPRKSSAASDGDASTHSTPASTRLQRYTEALQTSDAAATISKASTNMQAKAMASWSGTRSLSASSTPSKIGQNGKASLAELGNGWFSRVANAHDDISRPNAASELHPALRWSRDSIPPNIPLPNVNDSPSRRNEFIAPNNSALSERALGADENLTRSPVISVAGTPPTQSSGQFASLPSLQGVSTSSPRFSPRVPSGPKPLLLQRSARPPRENGVNGTHIVQDDSSSRKVSTGPLAANVSPKVIYRRRENGSISSRRDSSYTTASQTSSAYQDEWTDTPMLDGIADDSTSQTSKSDINPPAPPLKDLNHQLSPSITQGYASFSAQPSSPLAMNDAFTSRPDADKSSIIESKGTAPASAFARTRTQAINLPVDDSSAGAKVQSLEFGQIASSSDVPLAQKTSLTRKPHRKLSETTSGAGSEKTSSLHSSSASVDEGVFGSTGPRRTSRRSRGSIQMSG